MTTYLDHLPPYEQSESLSYHDRLKYEAEEVLFHPTLLDIFTRASQEHIISEGSVSALLSLQDKTTYASAVATLATAAFDRRRGTGIERHQLQDDSFSPPITEAIRQAVKELHMTNNIQVPTGSFDIAAVLGATAAPAAKRTHFLYDSLEKGATSASILVGLGAERPVGAIDKKYAHLYPYVHKSHVETELLAHAAEDWFKAYGYTTPSVDPSVALEVSTKNETLGSKYRIQTLTFEENAHKPQWAPDVIINLSSPFEKTHHPRATTGETIRFLLELADLQPGSKLLFTSSQPYLLGQKFEIQRLCLEAGVEVEVAGYGVDDNHLSAAALADELAKAITKAAALYAMVN